MSTKSSTVPRQFVLPAPMLLSCFWSQYITLESTSWPSLGSADVPMTKSICGQSEIQPLDDVSQFLLQIFDSEVLRGS